MIGLPLFYALLLGLKEASISCYRYNVDEIELYTDSQYGKDVLLRNLSRKNRRETIQAKNIKFSI